jgi:hypothetical protein
MENPSLVYCFGSWTSPPRSPLVRSFERHLRALNSSERTIATDLIGLRQADAFLRGHGTTLEHKFYARGVGPVLAVIVSGGSGREEFISFKHGPQPGWLWNSAT